MAGLFVRKGDLVQVISGKNRGITGKVIEVFPESDRVIVAGDDDQAIFRWAGADVNTFLELDGTSETLTQSWRVPATVHRLAESVVRNISDRYPKKYLPREEEGAIEWVSGVADLLEEIQTEGTWLILAQCAYMLDNAEEVLRAEGVFY